MLALIQGLPPEAAIWRGKEASWTVQEEMVHSILDRILLQQGIKMHRLPDLRPGDPKRRKNVMSVGDFAAGLRRTKEGGEPSHN